MARILHEYLRKFVTLLTYKLIHCVLRDVSDENLCERKHTFPVKYLFAESRAINEINTKIWQAQTGHR
jgi:hypothetical protein